LTSHNDVVWLQSKYRIPCRDKKIIQQGIFKMFWILSTPEHRGNPRLPHC